MRLRYTVVYLSFSSFFFGQNWHFTITHGDTLIVPPRAGPLSGADKHRLNTCWQFRGSLFGSSTPFFVVGWLVVYACLIFWTNCQINWNTRVFFLSPSLSLYLFGCQIQTAATSFFWSSKEKGWGVVWWGRKNGRMFIMCFLTAIAPGLCNVDTVTLFRTVVRLLGPRKATPCARWVVCRKPPARQVNENCKAL